MASEIESQINEYLSDDTKLYQDWYTAVTQAKTESKQYTTQVGVIPDVDELKRLFEKWFRKQRETLKKLCVEYCQKREQIKEHESLLIAGVADVLTVVFVGTPVNVAAIATILVVGKYLDRLCDCPKN
jgi:hypothetical protein